MKLYTKTGDKGTTSLVYGGRVSKTDARVEAYGTCDEANSMIGLALSHLHQLDCEGKEEIYEAFKRIQTTLFHVGAELATPSDKEVKWKLEEKEITYLEEVIDKWDQLVPPLTQFILPGGNLAAATLHVVRTIVRRAERKAVAIDEEVNPLVVAYLNRLSDFLFIAARYVNVLAGSKEEQLHQE